ncbi:MarR family transcriptional regulator [Nocardioides mangrovicus]|uniref:MarR family transcriptional regulator n=1 Tax=Nocardioides mangrovicus TaxID=2478913 RepID=A0A3L8P3K2_9ACTN|nr:MarR family transcriptional regulator [Nocardioides mangrovicus]RLV49970.1 MarR family transcriptional regulator [Nocardioides mangrovicus]
MPTSLPWHRELSVVLHDLAWLLPRTVGAVATREEPLPASELEIMRLLTRRPGLSVTEVADRLGLRGTNVSTAVGSLERRGLLERTPDEHDRRVVRVTPTRAAMGLRDRREARWGEAMAEALLELAPDDLTRLQEAVTALQSLAEGLSQHEE